MNAATQASFVPMTKTQVIETPLRKLRDGTTGSLWIKDETQQIGGAFKYRGSMSFLAHNAVPTGVVTTASTGNHATGLSLAAREFGYEARIFVPSGTPATKLARIEAAGGQITLVDGDYDIALVHAKALAASGAATLVSTGDHPDIVTGNSVIFQEINKALGHRPSRVYVPIGGGGIIAGAVRSSEDSQTQVIGVEFEPFARAQKIVDGHLDQIDMPATPAPASGEGIAMRSIGAYPVRVLQSAKHLSFATVDAEQMAKACRLIWQEMGIKAELGACATIAAALANGDQPGTTVCVVTGGNIGDDVFNAIQNNEKV
jgi:threonine dehydratase